MISRLDDEDIEKFLIPFVFNRFNLSDAGSSTLRIAWFRSSQEKRKKSLIITSKSLIRCLNSIEDRIHLKDITSVVLAETYAILESFPPCVPSESLAFVRTLGFKMSLAEVQSLFEKEIHTWLTYLQEVRMLPGYYDRYTGLFTKIADNQSLE